MFQILIKIIKRTLRNFKKLSPWLRLTLIILLISLSFVIVNKYKPQRENFIQQKNLL